jgi:hypothetical protein
VEISFASPPPMTPPPSPTVPLTFDATVVWDVGSFKGGQLVVKVMSTAPANSITPNDGATLTVGHYPITGNETSKVFRLTFPSGTVTTLLTAEMHEGAVFKVGSGPHGVLFEMGGP